MERVGSWVRLGGWRVLLGAGLRLCYLLLAIVMASRIVQQAIVSVVDHGGTVDAAALGGVAGLVAMVLLLQLFDLFGAVFEPDLDSRFDDIERKVDRLTMLHVGRSGGGVAPSWQELEEASYFISEG